MTWAMRTKHCRLPGNRLLIISCIFQHSYAAFLRLTICASTFIVLREIYQLLSICLLWDVS